MKHPWILAGLMTIAWLPAAYAQPASAETEEELEPLIVEAERGPLDGGGYGSRLPCVGNCEDETKENAVDRILRGLSTLFITSSIPEQPAPVDSLETVNPIKARLDDKQP